MDHHNHSHSHSNSNGRIMVTRSMSIGQSEKERLFIRNYNAEELLEAAQSGDADKVRLRLLYGADVNTTTPQSEKTALMLACENGHLYAAALLVKNGANLAMSDPHGRTALGYACERGFDEIAGYLLDHGSEVNHQDGDGFSALMLAARRGHAKTVHALLKRGADPKLKNRAGLTAHCMTSAIDIKRVLSIK